MDYNIWAEVGNILKKCCNTIYIYRIFIEANVKIFVTSIWLKL